MKKVAIGRSWTVKKVVTTDFQPGFEIIVEVPYNIPADELWHYPHWFVKEISDKIEKQENEIKE